MLSMLRRISLSALLASVAIARGQDRPPTGRLIPQPYKTGRSVVMAKNGMVATSQALATQIGLDVLRRGGTAVDAAIAADAALGLMEPMSCGIGGDLYAIVWDNKTKKLYGLNASGRSPYKATRDFFQVARAEGDSRVRPAVVVGARLRLGLGRTAPKVRQTADGRHPRPRRSNTPNEASRHRSHRRVLGQQGES